MRVNLTAVVSLLALLVIGCSKNIEQTPEGGEELGKPGPRITEEKAKEIALQEVPGEVTHVAIEPNFGKEETYVVEVVANDGPETDVIIDIQTGEVLGTDD